MDDIMNMGDMYLHDTDDTFNAFNSVAVDHSFDSTITEANVAIQETQEFIAELSGLDSGAEISCIESIHDSTEHDPFDEIETISNTEHTSNSSVSFGSNYTKSQIEAMEREVDSCERDVISCKNKVSSKERIVSSSNTTTGRENGNYEYALKELRRAENELHYAENDLEHAKSKLRWAK